jgi:predicted MPP superfamily phosphohydrolase
MIEAGRAELCMNIALAWIEWSGRVPPGLGTVAWVTLVAGECFLLLDLVGRVLGTYVRTAGRIVRRVCLVLLACGLLATPFVLAATQTNGPTTLYLVLSILLCLLPILNFFFPHRFGIRRIDDPGSLIGEEPLANRVALRKVTIAADLPRESPPSICCLVLSDLHCNTRAALQLLRDSLDVLRGRRYDMVLVLGDLGERDALLPEVMQAIASLTPVHGMFFVRGNHDFEWSRPDLIARLVRENSIMLLPNTAYAVPGLGIEIVGLEHPWHRDRLPAPSQGRFAIGLAHTPDNIFLFARLGVPLAVAGHTHGGKIKLPWIGSFPVPSKYGRFLDEGWFQLGPTRLYITPGVTRKGTFFRDHATIVELIITDRRCTPPDA